MTDDPTTVPNSNSSERLSTVSRTSHRDWQQIIDDWLVETNNSSSHTEPDPNTFHPSQIASCKRQCYLGKLGLVHHPPRTLGAFRTGTLIHEYLARMEGSHLNAAFEVSVDFETDGIHFTGRTDCYDFENDTIYDFKTRGDHMANEFLFLDPPNHEHVDQVLVYMHALDADYGQIVYVSKKNMEVETWPSDGLFEYDATRFGELVEKARTIRDVIRDGGIPRSAEDIPFSKCGCWKCEKELLADEIHPWS